LISLQCLREAEPLDRDGFPGKATLALDAAIWREARRELDTQAGLAFYFVNRRRRSKDACARTGALKAGLLFEWAAKTSVVSSGSFNLPQKCLSQGVNCFLSFDSPPSPLGISVDSSRPVSANCVEEPLGRRERIAVTTTIRAVDLSPPPYVAKTGAGSGMSFASSSDFGRWRPTGTRPWLRLGHGGAIDRA
jgi:hypothetical protein